MEELRQINARLTAKRNDDSNQALQQIAEEQKIINVERKGSLPTTNRFDDKDKDIDDILDRESN